MKTTDRIINLLKTQGSMTAKSLAEQLSMTTMGVRQHMQQLEDESQVVFEDKKAARGRPTRFWSLTNKTDSLFTNGHEELTVQLIDSVKTIFGDDGLDKLISHREKSSFESYKKVIEQQIDLESKIKALAQLRDDEGYMATIEKNENVYWLYENHCPICAAAKTCQNFCRSELQTFQNLFKNVAKISREEHIIEGARRCAYRILPL